MLVPITYVIVTINIANNKHSLTNLSLNFFFCLKLLRQKKSFCRLLADVVRKVQRCCRPLFRADENQSAQLFWLTDQWGVFFVWRCQTLHNCNFSHTPLPLPPSLHLFLVHHSIIHPSLFRPSLSNFTQVFFQYSSRHTSAAVCLSVCIHSLSITLSVFSPIFFCSPFLA